MQRQILCAMSSVLKFCKTTPLIALPVRLVEPLGKDTLLYFDTGSDRAFVVVTEGLGMSEVSVGAQLGLVLDAAHLHLFNQSGRRIGCAA